jgi:hypothetical protein
MQTEASGNSHQNKKTFYHLILDRSGSMADCWTQTMSGLQDQFMKVRDLQQKHPDQEFFISLCIFDNIIEFPVPVSPASGNYLHLIRGVEPRSNTALFDAIGDSIRHLEFHAGNLLTRKEASVIVVVLTDGQENASRRYSAEMIRREIDRLQATDLWTFSFLGADFDITETAAAFNAGANSSMNFSKANMSFAFDSLSSKMHEYAAEKQVGHIKKEFLK